MRIVPCSIPHHHVALLDGVRVVVETAVPLPWVETVRRSRLKAATQGQQIRVRDGATIISNEIKGGT